MGQPTRITSIFCGRCEDYGFKEPFYFDINIYPGSPMTRDYPGDDPEVEITNCEVADRNHLFCICSHDSLLHTQIDTYDPKTKRASLVEKGKCLFPDCGCDLFKEGAIVMQGQSICPRCYYPVPADDDILSDRSLEDDGDYDEGRFDD